MSRCVHRLQIQQFLAALGEGSEGLALRGAEHPLTWRVWHHKSTGVGGHQGRSFLQPLLKAWPALGPEEVVQHIPVSGRFSQEWLGQEMGSSGEVCLPFP